MAVNQWLISWLPKSWMLSMNRAVLTNVKKICIEWQKLTVHLLISDSNTIRD